LLAGSDVTVTLSSRDWAKWNLEHPYQKKGRRPGKGASVSVSKPTRPSFGDKAGSFGDKDLIAGFHAKADAMDHGKVFTAKRDMTDAEYAQHRKHVDFELTRHGTEDLLRSPFSTHISEDKVNGVEGLYTPSRRAQQEEILKQLEDRAKNVPNDRRAIVMGGIGGAGKSTILRTNAKHRGSVAHKLGIKYASYDEKGHGVGEPSNFLILNPDDIKGEMAKRGMIPKIDALSPLEANPFVHEEASKLAEDLAQRAQAQGKNVIWDVTLNSVKSGDKRINPLHAATQMGGYHVAGAFVDVSTAQSAKNAAQRHRGGQNRLAKGEGLGGRFVPSGLITGGNDPTGQYRTKNRAAFEELKPRFDQTLTIDNENYAGKLINETGSARKLAHRADDGTPPQSDITDQINAYRAGKTSLDELAQSLGSRTYDKPDYFDQADADYNDIEAVEHYQPGTWGEVEQARNTGMLTPDEFNQIADAAYQHHANQRAEFLEKRDWAKWNLLHPYQKKGRLHPDRSKHYAGRDLHAEGEWPIGHNPRYGAVIFNKEGTHVLLREPKNHYLGYHWTFAKGGPDPGESHVAVAQREALEETGRVPRIVSHLKGAFKTPHIQEPYVDKHGNQHHADGSYDEAPWTDKKGVAHEGGHHPGYGSSSANYFYLSQDAGAKPDYTKVIANGETNAVGWFTPKEARDRIQQGTIPGGVQRDLNVLDAAVAEMDRLNKGGTPTPPQPHNFPSAPEVKPVVHNPVATPSPEQGHPKPPKPPKATTSKPTKPKPTWTGSHKADTNPDANLNWEQLLAKKKKQQGKRAWLEDMLQLRFDFKHGWIPISPKAYQELADKAEKDLEKADATHHQAAEAAHHFAELAQEAQKAGDLHKAMQYAAQAHGASIHADAKKEAEATTHAAEQAKLHEFASKAGNYGTKAHEVTPVTEHTPTHLPSASSAEYEKGAKSPGSNPGNWYTHKGSGDRYLIKESKSAEHAYSEVAANEVYHEASDSGLLPHTLAPNVTIVKADNAGGIHGVASHAVGNINPVNPDSNMHKQIMREGFGIDALTSNYDFAGDWPSGSNLTLSDDGSKVIRIDQGGAMAFRGSGVAKPSFAPGKAWTDVESIRNGGQGQKFYGSMNDPTAAASLETAAKLDLNKVAERWKAAGIPESVSAPWLTVLKERQAQIPAIVAKLKGEPTPPKVEAPKVETKQPPHVVAEATVAVPAPAAAVPSTAAVGLADLSAYIKAGGGLYTKFKVGHLEGQVAAKKMAEVHAANGLTPGQIKVKVKARGSKLYANAKKAKESGDLAEHAKLFGQAKAHYTVANEIGKTGVPSGEAQKVSVSPPAAEVTMTNIKEHFPEEYATGFGGVNTELLPGSAITPQFIHEQATNAEQNAHNAFVAGQHAHAAVKIGEADALHKLAQKVEVKQADEAAAQKASHEAPAMPGRPPGPEYLAKAYPEDYLAGYHNVAQIDHPSLAAESMVNATYTAEGTHMVADDLTAKAEQHAALGTESSFKQAAQAHGHAAALHEVADLMALQKADEAAQVSVSAPSGPKSELTVQNMGEHYPGQSAVFAGGFDAAQADAATISSQEAESVGQQWYKTAQGAHQKGDWGMAMRSLGKSEGYKAAAAQKKGAPAALSGEPAMPGAFNAEAKQILSTHPAYQDQFKHGQYNINSIIDGTETQQQLANAKEASLETAQGHYEDGDYQGAAFSMGSADAANTALFKKVAEGMGPAPSGSSSFTSPSMVELPNQFPEDYAQGKSNVAPPTMEINSENVHNLANTIMKSAESEFAAGNHAKAAELMGTADQMHLVADKASGKATPSGPSTGGRELSDLKAAAEGPGFSLTEIQQNYDKGKAQALETVSSLTADAATLADLQDLVEHHHHQFEEHAATEVKPYAAAFALGKSHGWAEGVQTMQKQLGVTPSASNVVTMTPIPSTPTFHYEAPKVPAEFAENSGAYLIAHEAAFKQGQEMHAAGKTKQNIKAAASNQGYKKAKTAETPAMKAQYYGTAHGYAAAAKVLPTEPKMVTPKPETVAAAEAVGVPIPMVPAYDYSGVTSSDPYVQGLPGIVKPVAGAWDPQASKSQPTYAEVKIDKNLPKGWEALKQDPAFELPSHDQTAYITAYQNGKATGAKMTLDELATKISTQHEAYMASPVDTTGESHELGLKNGFEQAYEDQAKVQNLSAADQAFMQTKAAFLTEFANGKYNESIPHLGDAGTVKVIGGIESNPHGKTPAGATEESKQAYNEHIGQGYDEAMHLMLTNQASAPDVQAMAEAHISKAQTLETTDIMGNAAHAGLAQGAKRAAVDFNDQNNFAKSSSKSIISTVKVSPSSLEKHTPTTGIKPGAAGFVANTNALQVKHKFNAEELAGIKQFTTYYRHKSSNDFVNELSRIWRQQSKGTNMSSGAVQARAFINAVSTKAIPNKSSVHRFIQSKPGQDWYQHMFFRPDGTPKGPGDTIDMPVDSWTTNPDLGWGGDTVFHAPSGTVTLDIGNFSNSPHEIETVTGGRFVIQKIEKVGGMTHVYVKQDAGGFYARSAR
jgi:8-oxo-dGTP pyrophosphatase MutT (NUDIX family)